MDSSLTPYDLIFIDCQMPVLDGYEATRRIRNEEAGAVDQDVLVLAMTANLLDRNMRRHRDRSINFGICQDYFGNQSKVLSAVHVRVG